MRKNVLLLICLFNALLVFAGTPIEIKSEDSPIDPNENGRTLSLVTASIDDQILEICFSDEIPSQILIEDYNNQTVLNQSYNASYIVQANLTSFVAGSYTLYIYAYGVWWHGTFAIE